MTGKPTYEELERRFRELESADSDCKKALEASLEREERLRALFYGIPVALYRTAEDRRIIEANPALAEMLGFPDPQSLLYQDSARFLVRPEDQIKQRSILAREGVLHGYEVEFRRRDGSTLWVRDSSRRYHGPDGRVYYEGSLEDVTERKQAEQALKEKTKLLQVISENMFDLVSLTDTEGNFTFVGASHKILGYDPDSLLGRNVLEFVHAEDLPAVSAAFQDFLSKSDDNRKVEYRYRCADGSYLWFETVGMFIRDAGGNPGEILFSTRDVTQRKKHEETLLEREAFIKTVMDHLPIGVAVNSVDPTVEFSYMNDNFSRIYRTTREALAEPGTFWDVVYEDPVFREKIKNRVAEDVASGDPDRMYWEDVPFTRKGEGPFYICARNIPLKGRQVLISTVWDVTDRKLAEEALRDSRELLDATQRLARVGGWLWDVANQTMTWTDQTYRIHGFDSGEVVPGSPEHVERSLDCYDPDDRPVIETAFLRCVQEGVPYDLEFPFTSVDGQRKWIQTTAQPVFDGQRVVKVIGNIVDITERKQAEKALRTSEERYRRIAENMSDVVFIADLDLKTTYVSPSIERLVGESVAEHLKRRMEDKFPPESLDKIYTVFAEEMEKETDPDGDKKRSRLIEVEHFRPGGSTVWISINLSFVRDENGNPIAIQGVTRDITERKIAEEEREKLQTRLNQSQKMEAIGSLAGGVAHDLNNLLSPILGYGEMLRDDLDPGDTRRESLDEIMSAGLRARDLVRQLLAFSRKQILEFRPADLNKVVAGLKNLLQRTIREDIEMAFDLSPEPEVTMADIGQIEQVIMNLAVNAADAMPEGGRLTIETSNVYLDEEYAKSHQSVEPGKHLMLAVSDSGQGMDEATREHIFEPFFSTKGEHGTGLGLSTVYGIVKQHGGNIWVYSEPGRGTTFKIYLPVADKSKAEEKARPETTRDLKGDETILIVEDNDQVRRLAKSVLSRNGYRVLDAEDGREALEILEGYDGPVHLLLSDVVLHGMNGKEIYKEALAMRPSLKVLYMSGYTGNVIAHRGVLDEGVQFIQKPFTVHGLATKVRELLDEK